MVFSPASQSWQPTATMEALRLRARLLNQVRGFFDQRDFLEVQTPCLMPETVVDAHLTPLTVTPNHTPTASAHPTSESSLLFLQTSPEAAMKRLMAAGAEAIYQLGPVFRADELGQFHNLEFTMLEWYRRGDSMEEGIRLLVELIQQSLPGTPVERMTYRQLFQRELGIDPLESDIGDLQNLISKHEPSFQFTAQWQRDDLLDVLMGFVLQPRLTGVIAVSNYPISQAALARRSDEDPQTAERFELFIGGVEIANGYAELCDANELLLRTDENNQRRMAIGLPSLPTPNHLVEAMKAGFPNCSGTALGFDRLAMIVGGFSNISQVLTFPITTN